MPEQVTETVPPDPRDWQLRITDRDGNAQYGAAVLVTSDHVVTCAHVVEDATGGETGPGAQVRVDDPRGGGTWAAIATVVEDGWWHGDRYPWDIAVLRLDRSCPAVPVRIAEVPPFRGHVRVVGLPFSDTPAGRWVTGRVIGSGGRYPDYVQIDAVSPAGSGIMPGFSGSGVRSEREDTVVGIMCEATEDGRLGWMVPMDTIPKVWPQEEAAHGGPGTDPAPLPPERLESMLFDAIRGMSAFHEDVRRGSLRNFLREWPVRWDDDEPGEACARRVASAAVEDARVSELLRILRHVEDDGSSLVRGAGERFAPWVWEEDREGLLAGVRPRDRFRAEQLLDALYRDLSASPYEPWADAYVRSLRGSLVFLQDGPRPVNLWEAFRDLADAARTEWGPPLAIFTEILAQAGQAETAGLLRYWCELAGLGAVSSLPPPSTGPAPPARLVVWLYHGEGDGYRIDTWTVLATRNGGEPTRFLSSSGQIKRRDFGHEVYKIFLNFSTSSEVQLLDWTRIDLVLSFEMLAELDAPHWECHPSESDLGMAPRLGTQTAIVYQVEEFFLGQRHQHKIARSSTHKRWMRLHREGKGDTFDIERDPVPDGLRFPEHISYEGIIFLSGGYYEEGVLPKRFRDAALLGVPVIASRARQNPSKETLRDVLVGNEGRVDREEIEGLPKLLYHSRSGRSREGLAGRVPIPDSMNINLIYHDLLPHPLWPGSTPLADHEGPHEPQGGSV
ncbi:trypsin-like serine peptidase [Nocardiopsis sp. LOL_012]|uniref:trypsin-like serine peptidase n=1 Tax=Nocardiopsis sp. LOL_012 TaxID=3345409 RepID=UPI003A842D33